jgi:2-polyprenyl-6-methoxyphenol hydroxylase-like FAD-dependent oxidoreductase
VTNPLPTVRTEPRVKIVIVGGGPVGLAMAVLLERFNIDYVLVERSSTVTDHPKARGVDIRTMELFRQWGVEDKIKARGLPPGADVFAVVETLSGFEYGRTKPELDIGHSPSWRCMVSQDVVEEELLDAIKSSASGRIRFSTEFVNFEAAADGIKVAIRDLQSGGVGELTADYLIGADGAGSSVRRHADIEMRGPATLAVMANEYWMADLSALPRINATAAYRILPKMEGEAVWTVLNTNGKNRWLSAGNVGSQRDERELPRTDEEVIRLARRQTGIPDLEVKVISRSTWRLSRQVAAKFSSGRVFLIGDAAHRFPPNGGFGMNSGIQDAHNLAWKLKFVFDGKAGSALLDTYDSERRPVAESNADFSLGNQKRFLQTDIALRSGNRDQIEFWIRDTDNHLHSSGQSLGFSYEEGAVVQDGTVKLPLQSRYYVPSDRPGSRFPHIWLDLARTKSTLDWFDREFVVVAGPKADPWLEAAREVSEKIQLPIQTRQLDAADEKAGLLLGLRGALLVRPDGHVAWRMPWLPTDPIAALGSAALKILARH